MQHAPTAQPQTAIEFAYEHFGRHVAPDAIDGWLRKPAMQNKQLRIGKGCIIVRPSGITVFGKADYTGWGFKPALPMTDRAAVLSSLLYFPASEPFLVAQFALGGLPAYRLHLNRPGDAIHAYWDATQGQLISVRHGDLRAIAQALRSAGVKASNASSMLHLALDVIGGVITHTDNPTRWAQYEKSLEVVPALPVLAERMVQANISPTDIKKFMEATS